MSVRSRLNSRAAALLAFAFCLAPQCFADGVRPADPLLRYRTSGGMQGMYEVREEARKFLKRQPPPVQGKWAALLPDVRTFVPTCAVPLRTRWAVPSDGEEGGTGVIVTCQKSTDKKYKKWNAFVAVSASPICEVEELGVHSHPATTISDGLAREGPDAN